ncbi:TPA: hypothetical protein U2C13_001613 [Streptococcus suis]|nr:hypothetical protein [Streptococcus suis]
MRELAIKREEIATKDEDRQLSVQFLKNKNINLEQIGNYFATIVNSYKEIQQNINAEEMYVVKFTKEQLKKYQNGEIDFQRTADRTALLPNFVKKGTNNEIVSKARLEKIVLDNPEAFQNVTSNVNQLANAQKIADLEILLTEVKQIVLEVKLGLKDDRRSKILGAESTINQALMMPDDNPQKQVLLLNSISHLNEGREALIKEFENEIKKNISIPNSKWQLFLKSVFDEKFNQDVLESFSELNEQFSYIVKSTELLAKTYMITGNHQLIDSLYTPVKLLVEKNQEYVGQLLELQDVDNELERQLKWCVEPAEFIAQIGMTELADDDIIAIEFTGEELLRGGISNG